SPSSPPPRESRACLRIRSYLCSSAAKTFRFCVHDSVAAVDEISWRPRALSAAAVIPRSAAVRARIQQHRNNQNNQIEAFNRQSGIDHPCIDNRSNREKDEAQKRNHQPVIRPVEPVREQPHQHQDYSREGENDQRQQAGHARSSEHSARQCAQNYFGADLNSACNCRQAESSKVVLILSRPSLRGSPALGPSFFKQRPSMLVAS